MISVTRNAARPDHAAVAQVQGVVALKDTTKAKPALVLVALVPAVVGDSYGRSGSINCKNFQRNFQEV